MAEPEDKKPDNPDVKPEEDKKPELQPAPEPTPVELEAMEQGWVPKEDWEEGGRDPDEWRTAKEFVDRGKLYKTIHQTNRELKQTQATLEALRKHHQFVFEKAHKQAVDDLKREKRAAIRNEDLEAAEAIEQELDELKENHQKEKEILQREQAQAQAQGPNPEFQAWLDGNTWYVEDSELREFADATALIYMQRNQGAAPQTVLKHVESSVRRKFPEKLGVKRAAPNAVNSVDRTNRGKPQASDTFEMDDMEREIMRQLVTSGEMTESQYKAELRKAKGVK
jgi:hypothetical protein